MFPFLSFVYRSPVPGEYQIFREFFSGYFKIYWGILSLSLAVAGISKALGFKNFDLVKVMKRAVISSVLIGFWPQIVDWISKTFNEISAAILPSVSYKTLLEQLFGIAITYLISKKQLYFFLAFYGLRWYGILLLSMAIPCALPFWILGYSWPLRVMVTSYISLLAIQVINAALTLLMQNSSGISNIPLALSVSIGITILPWIYSALIPMISLLRGIK